MAKSIRVRGRISIMHGDADFWEQHRNTVLEDGEMAFNSTTNEIKIGDGISTYNGLTSVVAGSEAMESLREALEQIQTDLVTYARADRVYTKSELNLMFNIKGTRASKDELEREEDPKPGDAYRVKENNGYEDYYALYVYDGTSWILYSDKGFIQWGNIE